jgi:hypothetical protein
MIIVRSSTVVDVPLELAGQHWADYARKRLHDHDSVPDEWLVKDKACGMSGSGDVAFEPVSAARTRVTLAVLVEVDPSHPGEGSGAEVEETYHRVAALLDRYRDFAESR